MGGIPGDKDKIALLMISLAFQLHVLCIATTGKFEDPDDDNDLTESIQAFLIIALLLYLGAFIMSVLINFGNLGGKIAKIITVVIACCGVACLFLGVTLVGAAYDQCEDSTNCNGANTDSIPPFSYTTYIMGGALEATGAVFMLFAMCC